TAAIRAKPTSQAPTIHKHPSRPHATAAVHEAAHRLIHHPERPSPTRSQSSPEPSPSSSHDSIIGIDRIEALERQIATLKLSVKLIPLQQRPKGQSTAGLAAGIHFDNATMKHTVLNDSTVASEKVFPDFQTLLNALSTYLVIRDLYDVDNIEFGSAIGLYIR